MIDGVKGEFETGGNAEFVEDSEKVIANRVFTEMELTGNVAVGAALGYELDHREEDYAVLRDPDGSCW